MSVKVMSAVFDRYPEGGGEMLLALALADHASDDGSNVYPSIAALAEKTRQSERSVQYQLRKMEQTGWLILVNSGNGGRNQRREYVISSAWIKGAEIAPFKKGAIDGVKGAEIAPLPAVKGAIHDAKGCNPRQERVQPIAPAYNHQGIIREPLEKTAQAQAPAHTLLGISEQLFTDFLAVRKAKRAGPLTATALAGIQREADKAGLSLAEAITACCEFGWQGFNAAWFADRKPKTVDQATQSLSFAEQDRQADRERIASLTGKPLPAARQAYAPATSMQHMGTVIDVSTQTLEIAR